VQTIRSCGVEVAGVKIRNPKSAVAQLRAFTLLELLVVIAILGILAALSVPALKNLGKSNVQVSAARQLLDDVGRARQLAISQHTTVYMVFVPEFFWLPPSTASTTWTNSLTPTEFTIVVNLLDKQFTGYTFVSLRSVGDQPGRGVSRYLSEWKSLPDGAFIAANKFYVTNYITDHVASATYQVNPFYYSTKFPFPVETNLNAGVSLPYIAFNYLGQLALDDTTLWPSQYEYIPLAQGTVAYAANINKALQFAAPDVTENPPGNSTNSMFTVIRIDRLTGRATQLQQKVQ